VEERLLEEARRVGKHRTKREALVAALQEYVQRRKQVEATDAFGSFNLDGGTGSSSRREKGSR